MKTNLLEKRDYIHSHFHQVKEPEIDELYNKLVSYLDDVLIVESEEDIKNGNLTSHEAFKQEIDSWRNTK